MSVSTIRRVMGAATLSAVVLFAFDGAAELPPGVDKKVVADAFEAVTLDSCKLPGGPRGEGRVLVTFAPSGKATSAVVDTPAFARTKAEKCIVKAYTKIRVPAFKGEPFVVGKKFKLE